MRTVSICTCSQASRYSSAARGLERATSTSARIRANGVRSSWAALAVKSRILRTPDSTRASIWLSVSDRCEISSLRLRDRESDIQVAVVDPSRLCGDGGDRGKRFTAHEMATDRRQHQHRGCQQ